MKYARVPHSAKSKVLIELLSFHGDLEEAANAFAHALDALANEDADMARLFASSGVIAYGRCYTISARRGVLSDSIHIPVELESIHQHVMDARHNSVAHSAADTQVPLLLLKLEEEAGQPVVRGVHPFTLHAGIPRDFVVQAAELVEWLLDQLMAKMSPISDEIEAAMSATETRGLWDAPYEEMVSLRAPNDWSFKTRRRRQGGPLGLNIDPEPEPTSRA
jgi:hypothetical protein